jgi:alkylmercury lyase
MIEATLKISVQEIVERLRNDSGGLNLEPAGARLFVKTLRALAEGSPITAEHVAQIAGEAELSVEQANEVLNWLAERDDNDNIVGLAGLSLNDWSHRFEVNGRDLKTWCGLDTLYLPPLLDQVAQVESTDPVTQETVRVTVGPEGVEQVSPSSAVISIVVPKIKEKGLESAEEIWTAFCHYSLYFSSQASAEEWFQNKSLEPTFLSIKEGFQVGRDWLVEDVLSSLEAEQQPEEIG